MCELRPVARERGLALPERSLERSRIKLEQRLPLGHLLPVGEKDLDDLPVDARLDGDCRVRLDVADCLDAQRHGFGDDRRDDHRHRGAAAGFLFGGAGAFPGAPCERQRQRNDDGAGQRGRAQACIGASHRENSNLQLHPDSRADWLSGDAGLAPDTEQVRGKR
jgi:hypothetical protein